MPAPTALKKPTEEARLANDQLDADMHSERNGLSEDQIGEEDVALFSTDANEDGILVPTATITEDSMAIDEEGRPQFAPAKDIAGSAVHIETRKIPIPPHRMTPLKQSWPTLYPPLVENLKLQCRMNIKRKAVELRTSSHTTDTGALQKGEDFVKAFALGVSKTYIGLLRGGVTLLVADSKIY